MTFFNTFYL